MKRFILTGLFSFMVGAAAIAQNPTETLRYSQQRPGGTARALGVGGAFGAIGADYTAVGINPGGLGLYRRSDLSLSFGVQSTSANTNLFGSSADAHQVRAFLPNASIVLSRLRRKSSNWKAFNFGFGFNRLANYNANSVFVNKQSSNSLLNQYRDELTASGLTEDQISFDNLSPGAVLGYLRTLSEELNISIADLILGGGEDHVFLATGEDLPGLLIGNVSAGSGLTVLGNEKAPDTWRHFD